MTDKGATPAEAYVETRENNRRGGAREGTALSLLISSAAGVQLVAIGAKRALVLGRVPECDVVVADGSVSRQHARLVVGETGFMLEDLGSTNGTTVQGRALTPREPVPVGVGTVFEIGTATLVLQRAPALAPDHPRDAPPPSKPTIRPAASSKMAPVIHDPRMRRIYAMLDVIAPSQLGVLVLGETGVGKEVFAEAIHERSARTSGPFVKLNCAALPESILEGELFGYEKGAFTGAVQAKAGLFESASGGTVFLDEIGEVPLSTQAKLLRVLESGEVMRLGALKTKTVDVRFISATNRDLRKEIAVGRFRADLFFRLNGISITLPPLRKRKEEIATLARRFTERAAARLGRTPPALSDAAIAALEAHDWPGNVRELKNVIERAVVLCPTDTLDASGLLLGDDTEGFDDEESTGDLEGEKTPAPTLRAGGVTPPPIGSPTATEDTLRMNASPRLREAMESFEKQRVLDALASTDGNQSRAARLLGVSRRTLINKIEQYGIARPRKGRSD